ncbi:unnamed protein product [Clonostachys solani]|uniref:Uncharacterized protein n=1 Tax=Clonostachys solani TaxID=160281 RepID=A0A9N9ZLC3_9HYPO|nr:unnamed protein product [Clonostachys solani]
MATFQGSKNPFISELVPMALSNDSILDSLLAYSGIHYADHAGVPADETTWIHYGQAVQAQKFGLTWLAQGNDHVLVPLLVTAMLLCIAETFRENSGRLALYHLRALSALIQKALRLPESQLPKDTRAFLIERYMYTMTLAHITMGSESDEWVLNDGNILYPMLESSPIHALFKLIPRVSVLSRHWAAETQAGSVSDSLFREKEELYTLISSWEPNSREINYTLCGIVYQQALLVYLASIPEGNREALSGYPDTVQELFDTFLPFLMSTPPESPISTMLCWPLAIFGSCAGDGEHRRVIHERLQLLSQIYSAQSVRDTMILLEKMWAENPGPSSPLSFERIMKREGMTHRKSTKGYGTVSVHPIILQTRSDTDELFDTETDKLTWDPMGRYLFKEQLDWSKSRGLQPLKIIADVNELIVHYSSEPTEKSTRKRTTNTPVTLASPEQLP